MCFRTTFSIVCIVFMLTSAEYRMVLGFHNWDSLVTGQSYRIINELNSWFNARASCESRGGTLADVSEVQQYLYRQSVQHPHLHPCSLDRTVGRGKWIGTDLPNSNNLEGNSSIPVNFLHWMPEKSDLIFVHIEGRCLLMINAHCFYKGIFNLTCTSPHYAICQFPLRSSGNLALSQNTTTMRNQPGGISAGLPVDEMENTEPTAATTSKARGDTLMHTRGSMKSVTLASTPRKRWSVDTLQTPQITFLILSTSASAVLLVLTAMVIGHHYQKRKREVAERNNVRARLKVSPHYDNPVFTEQV